MFKLRGKQQEVLYLPQNGHNVVCGVAGSGKSVCAVMRAKYIQELTNGKVLLLTYNNSLINYMKDIHSDLRNIEVTTYHKFATRCMRRVGILDSNDILNSEWSKKNLIERALTNVKRKYLNSGTGVLNRNISFKAKKKERSNSNLAVLNRDISFFVDEIGWMQGFGALDIDTYENIERSGRRSARLVKADRKYVFEVYEEYTRLRAASGKKYDWKDCSYYLNEYLKEHDSYPEYESIIIDEGQDFTPMMIQSLVNYMNGKGSVLYLGDQAQQIYGKGRMSWKQLGLKISKVYTLDENHRNTKQIEKLTNKIRETLELDDSDGRASVNSSKEGDKPIIASFIARSDEDNYIVKKLAEFKFNGSTCIVVKKDEIDHYGNLLSMKGIDYNIIDRETADIDRTRGIFISNYHSIKGLEFDNIIMPGCSVDMFENKLRGFSDEEREEKKQELSKLIYVGLSRAKENLVVTYCNDILEIIPTDEEICDFYVGE